MREMRRRWGPIAALVTLAGGLALAGEVLNLCWDYPD